MSTPQQKRSLALWLALCVFIGISALADPITNRTHLVGTNVVTRVGYLAEDIMQHPVMTVPSIDGSKGEAQFYFDIGEKPMQTHQIIVVHPLKLNIPTERGRKIELKGTVDRISFKGGKAGNTGYENEVFHLQSWRYLRDTPSQPPPAN